MKWDNVNEIFPLGHTLLPNGRDITNEELKESDIATVFRTAFERAPEGMITKKIVYFWGNEGQFKIETLYDVYDQTPHPDPNYYPLNVYGQQMLNDYLYLNNIKLDK